MKVRAAGISYTVCSPAELLNRNTKDFFKTIDIAMDPETAARVANIVAIHSNQYFDLAVQAAYMICNDLIDRYDFRIGIDLPISTRYFPEYILSNSKTRTQAIDFLILILKAFGWIVSLKTDKIFSLDFTPLESLSPEDVAAEIEARVNEIAGKALSTINSGLVQRQNSFTHEQLGLDQIDPQDYLDVFAKLAQLLGPRWTITDKRDFTISVLRNTPQ